MSKHSLSITVNGQQHSAEVEARTSLADFLRDSLGFTGVHLGCEHGVCGACTVMVNGSAVRACLMLAVQARGCEVITVEGLADSDGSLHPVQQALADEHGLQCGFCTPGIAITLAALTQDGMQASADDLEAAMSGHTCRCTGYQGIRRAVSKLGYEVKGTSVKGEANMDNSGGAA